MSLSCHSLTHQFSFYLAHTISYPISRLYPAGLLEALKSSDSGVGKFVALVSADCELPTAIWSAPVREELRSKVLARLQRFNLVQAGGQGAAAKASPLAGREEDEMAWLKVFR